MPRFPTIPRRSLWWPTAILLLPWLRSLAQVMDCKDFDRRVLPEYQSVGLDVANGGRSLEHQAFHDDCMTGCRTRVALSSSPSSIPYQAQSSCSSLNLSTASGHQRRPLGHRVGSCCLS